MALQFPQLFAFNSSSPGQRSLPSRPWSAPWRPLWDTHCPWRSRRYITRPEPSGCTRPARQFGEPGARGGGGGGFLGSPRYAATVPEGGVRVASSLDTAGGQKGADSWGKHRRGVAWAGERARRCVIRRNGPLAPPEHGKVKRRGGVQLSGRLPRTYSIARKPV